MSKKDYRKQVTELVRKKLREDKRTIYEISQSVGVAFGAIRKLISGGTQACFPGTLMRLASYYGVPYEADGLRLMETGGVAAEAGCDAASEIDDAGVTMTTGDAARYLGLTKQTIRNLVDRGMIRTAFLGKNDMAYVLREDVEALLPKTRAMADEEQAIESLTKQLRTIGRVTDKDLQQARRCREAYLDRHYGIRNLPAAIDMWEALYDGLMDVFGKDTPLTERERIILRQSISGQSFDELQAVFGVSKERIRQIAGKLRWQLRHLQDSLRQARDSRVALEKENTELRRRVAELESSRAAEKTDSGASLLESGGYTLDTRLEDCRLSFRTLNCCRSADVRTIRDLVQLDKSDLLRWRNFGKKSLREIFEFLDSLGLSLGMRA